MYLAVISPAGGAATWVRTTARNCLFLSLDSIPYLHNINYPSPLFYYVIEVLQTRHFYGLLASAYVLITLADVHVFFSWTITNFYLKDESVSKYLINLLMLSFFDFIWIYYHQQEVKLSYFSCFKHFLDMLCPSTGKHTIFGRVCRGMEVIKRLGSVQTDNSDR